MKALKLSIIFTFLIVMIFVIIDMMGEPLPEIQDTDYIHSQQLITTDSIAEQYIADGWSADAAYILAGFETDLLDESDTAEYRLYVMYKED